MKKIPQGESIGRQPLEMPFSKINLFLIDPVSWKKSQLI